MKLSRSTRNMKASNGRAISLSVNKSNFKRTSWRRLSHRIKGSLHLLYVCAEVAQVLKSGQQEELPNSVTCDRNNSKSWSELPQEIMMLFLSRLGFADHVHFSAVCKPWRLAAVLCSHHRALGYPWLMFSQEPETGAFGLFSLTEGKTYNLELPVARGARCIGSSEGWLVMVDRVLGNYVLHPFSDVKIKLPFNPYIEIHFNESPMDPLGKAIYQRLTSRQMKIMTHPSYIRKVILLPSRNSDAMSIGAHVVLAIYFGFRLAFLMPGDAQWSLLDDMRCFLQFHDIIFYEEQAYAVTRNLELMVFEFCPHFKGIYRVGIAPPEIVGKHKIAYLVESVGELWMVVRFVDVPELHGEHFCGTTFSFLVYKLDRRGRRWVSVENLGDRAFFVGAGCSTSCLADGHSGFRGNCVYFTDNNFYFKISNGNQSTPCSDLGIFCLDDGSIQPLPPKACYSRASPPIWFTPGH